MKQHNWIVVTIEEPFPIMFAHVAYPSERTKTTAKGPFYSSPVKRYMGLQHRAHAEWSAAELRKAGWTVTVTEETR